MTTTFVTGNSLKFEIAKGIFNEYGLSLEQIKMETPEIQSDDVKEIASYSSKFAANELKKPVMVTDVGYYIPVLNGFPGPLIKYINQWLQSDDLLRLMQGIEDRTILVRECLAYCEPGKEPICFETTITNTLALQAEGEGSAVDTIMILQGFSTVQAVSDKDEVNKFWLNNLQHYRDLAVYLNKI
jgi:XTP/dITP diphosphohydrolase